MDNVYAYRAMINQPSKLQDNHKHHGKIGIFIDDNDKFGFGRIYFCSGSIHSMRIHKNCIDRIKLSSAED